MKLVSSTEVDKVKLAEFLKNDAYQAPLDITIDRTDDFTAHYELLSNDYVTLCLIDKHKEIHAMATICFQEAVVSGEKQIIGVASDLRVSKKRRAITLWAKYFLPKLKEERDKRNCKYIFSTVNKFQRQAYNAFIHPRTKRANWPRYYLFRKFNLVTLHGLIPFAEDPLNSITIESAKESDILNLQKYIKKKQVRRPIYYPEVHNDFLSHISRWKGLSLNDILVAKDKDGKIIGCLSLFNPSAVQSLTVKRWGQRGLTFKELIGFLSLFGLSRRLPHKNEALNFRHINHIYVNNQDIFYALLRSAWNRTSKNEFLAFARFGTNIDTEASYNFIKSNISYGLYCILAPDDPIPDFLKPIYIGHQPDFESAFI